MNSNNGKRTDEIDSEKELSQHFSQELRSKRSLMNKDCTERRQKPINTNNITFQPDDFNEAMDEWLKNKGASVTDNKIKRYINIFSQIPDRINLKKLELMIDENFGYKVCYVFKLLQALNLKTWPIDFIKTRSDIEHQPETEDSRRKITILDELYHPDNPKLPDLLAADYNDAYRYYSILNRKKHNIADMKREIAETEDGFLLPLPLDNRTFKQKIQQMIREENHTISQIKLKLSTLLQKNNIKHFMACHKIDIAHAKIKETINFNKSIDSKSIELHYATHFGKEKLDNFILSELQKYISYPTVKDLDRQFTVRYIQGGMPNTSGAHTDQKFSLRQILLGEADRGVFVMPGGSQLLTILPQPPQTILNLLRNKRQRLAVADSIMGKIKKDIKESADNITLHHFFKCLSLGRIINALHMHSDLIFNNDHIYSEIANGFIDGVVLPEPVIFEGNVVPDIYFLNGEDYRIFISNKTGEVLLCNVLDINEKLPHFIKKHLSNLQKSSFIAPTEKPKDYINRSTNHHSDPYTAVLYANLDKKLSDLNGAIYTLEERDFKLNNDLEKALIQSADLILMFATAGLSKTASMFITIVSALAFGMGNIYLDEQLASKADRYEDLFNAQQNILLGKIFMAVNLAIPALSHLKGKNTTQEIISDFTTSAKYKTQRINGFIENEPLITQDKLIAEEQTISFISSEEREQIRLEIRYSAEHKAPGSFSETTDGMSQFRTIKLEHPILKTIKSLYIEEDAYERILSHGIETESTPIYKFENGHYIDYRGLINLPVAGKTFSVNEYNINKNTLNLKTNDEGILNLYIDDDTYIRIREESNKKTYSYNELSQCRVKRLPDTVTICGKIFISENLDNYLNQTVLRNNTSQKDIFTSDLSFNEDDFIPNLYINNENDDMYFFHRGKFFNAEFIDEKKPLLRLFSRGGLLRRKNEIAIISSEKKGNDIYLKTYSEFLSEKTNININTVNNYLENKKINNMHNVKEISGVVEQKILSQQHYIPEIQPREEPAINFKLDDQIITRTLYPERIIENKDVKIEIMKLTQINDSSPIYLRLAKRKVSSHVTHIKNEIIPNAIQQLERQDKNTMDYVQAVLHTKETKFVHKAAKILSNRLRFLRRKLNNDDIYLSSIVKEPIIDEPAS